MKIKWMGGLVLLAVAALPLQAFFLGQDFEDLTVGSYSDANGDVSADAGYSYWGGDKEADVETGRFDGKSGVMKANASGSSLYYLPGGEGREKGVLEFDYSLETNVGNGWDLSMCAAADSAIIGLMVHRGYIQVRSNNSWKVLMANNDNMASNHIEFAYDSGNIDGGAYGTFTVTLNGTLLSYDNAGAEVSDLGLNKPIGVGVRYMFVKDRQADAGDFYIDNIVNRPPPGTLSLVVVGVAP